MISVRKACPNCPFRVGSVFGYDPAGLEALDEGYVPSCHCKVGAGNQFNDPIPSAEIECIGYFEFLANSEGFQRPYLAPLPRTPMNAAISG